MIDCQRIADFLLDYIEGNLEDDVHTAFREHMDLCPCCVQYVETYRRTLELGRQLDEDAAAEIPDELVQGILEARKRES